MNTRLRVVVLPMVALKLNARQLMQINHKRANREHLLSVSARELRKKSPKVRESYRPSVPFFHVNES